VIDLATVTAADFEALTDRQFERVAGEGQPALAVRLTEVRRGQPWPGGRDPFALTFVGPADVTLEPGIQPLRHAQIGDLELFLTPVAADAQTRTYEAVFG
jgi:hypothetical protein